MNKLLWILILAPISQNAVSQNIYKKTIWHLTIVDSATLKCIEGATISAFKQGNFVTDIHGETNLNKSIVDQSDSIRISHIGYKTVLFKPLGIYPDTIKLSASVKTLKEVTIISNFKKIVLGNVKESYIGGYLPGPNQEIAEYIPNNNKISGTITSVEFVLLDSHKGIKSPFKVNLYLKSVNDVYPGKALLKDSVIVYNPKGLSKVSIDISKYNIQIPENGFFAAFETLSTSWYGKDKILINGEEFFRIPGIKGIFSDRRFAFDQQEKEDVKYSLIRNIQPSSDWDKFEYGTDFAIGVTINPQ